MKAHIEASYKIECPSSTSGSTRWIHSAKYSGRNFGFFALTGKDLPKACFVVHQNSGASLKEKLKTLLLLLQKQHKSFQLQAFSWLQLAI